MEKKQKSIVQGNEATAMGAIESGLGFYAGYPITPSSDIMHYIARVSEKNKSVKFIQSEDELAAINSIIGASLAGAKSMTATSGPGLSLMQEGLSYGYKMRVPLVLVDVMRMGPSTGMPTIGSQQDISLIGAGPHGDTIPICFVPNSVKECYIYSKISFCASEEMRNPVILTYSGFIGQMYENFDLEEIEKEYKKIIQKRKIPQAKRKEKPIGKTGKELSKRYFTGLINDEDYKPATTNINEFKRWLKEYKEDIEKNIEKYNFYEFRENKKSNTLIIAYGIVSRLMYELEEDYAIFRPIRLFPVLEKELINAAKNYENIFVIEMNNGQYAKEVERVLKRDIKKISIYGIDHNPEEIKELIENQIKK